MVALEALSSWSSLQHTPSNLTVTASSNSKTAKVDLQAGMMIPEVMKLDGDSVNIKVEGNEGNHENRHVLTHIEQENLGIRDNVGTEFRYLTTQPRNKYWLIIQTFVLAWVSNPHRSSQSGYLKYLMVSQRPCNI